MKRTREEFWALLEPEYANANRFCCRLCGNTQEGEDLLQEAVLQSLEKFEGLREIGAFKTWLYRIIVNQYRQNVRRPWWKRFVPVPQIPEPEVSADPVRQLTARHLLESALGDLPAEEQALIVLQEIEGWSISDLSQLSGKSEAAVKVQLHRTRKRLKETITRAVKRLDQVTNEPLTDQRTLLCSVAKSENE